MSELQLNFIRDGIHTHLVLPADALLSRVPSLKEYFKGYQWIRVGWGDYRYYGASHQPVWLGLRALFLPTSAVIGLLGTNDINQELSDQATLYSITVNQALMESVALFVSRHVKLDKHQQPTKVRDRHCGTQFFKSHGIYLLLNTCNNWTSYGLSRAGLHLHPMLNFLPGQVERSVRKNGYTPLNQQLPS
jgi:hypothetical protein